MNKILILALMAVTLSSASIIQPTNGWILELPRDNAHVLSNAVPDPDFNHFITTLDRPYFKLDEFFVGEGFEVPVPVIAYHEVPTAHTPEPNSGLVFSLTGGCLILFGLYLKQRRQKAV
jgi:hypothetical protein